MTAGKTTDIEWWEELNERWMGNSAPWMFSLTYKVRLTICLQGQSESH